MVSQHSNYMYEDQLVGMLYRNFHKHSNPPTLLKLYLSWVPYSGKLSREKTFANWWKIHFSRRKRSRIAPFSCANGCHAPKFRRDNFHEQSQNHEIRESFLPRKFPTIRYASDVWDPNLVKDIVAIENVQKFALRVCSKQWSSTYDTLLNALTVPTLFSRRKC